jgi:hypothetical protein
MGKLQGLLFALATIALVALATFYFTHTWLPPLKSDRAAIDDAIWLSYNICKLLIIND